jgi:hypothetical protein
VKLESCTPIPMLPGVRINYSRVISEDNKTKKKNVAIGEAFTEDQIFRT